MPDHNEHNIARASIVNNINDGAPQWALSNPHTYPEDFQVVPIGGPSNFYPIQTAQDGSYNLDQFIGNQIEEIRSNQSNKV